MAETTSLSNRLAQIRAKYVHESPMNVELRCLRELWIAKGDMFSHEVCDSLCYLIDVYVTPRSTGSFPQSDEHLEDTSLFAGLLIENFSKGRIGFFQTVLRVCKERELV